MTVTGLELLQAFRDGAIDAILEDVPLDRAFVLGVKMSSKSSKNKVKNLMTVMTVVTKVATGGQFLLLFVYITLRDKK